MIGIRRAQASVSMNPGICHRYQLNPLAAHQAPPSLEFSRQEYWSELPYPSSRDFPNSGIKPRPPALQADSLPLELPGKPEPPGSGKQIRKVYTISDGMGVMKKGKAGEHERVNSTVNFYGYLCKT